MTSKSQHSPLAHCFLLAKPSGFFMLNNWSRTITQKVYCCAISSPTHSNFNVKCFHCICFEHGFLNTQEKQERKERKSKTWHFSFFFSRFINSLIYAFIEWHLNIDFPFWFLSMCLKFRHLSSTRFFPSLWRFLCIEHNCSLKTVDYDLYIIWFELYLPLFVEKTSSFCSHQNKQMHIVCNGQFFEHSPNGVKISQQ